MVSKQRHDRHTARRRRALALVGVVLAVATLTACAGGSGGAIDPAATTLPLAGTVAPPESGSWLGVFRPPAPVEISAFDQYKQISDKRPAFLSWYQAWDGAGERQFRARWCVSTYERGAVPLITWEPWAPTDSVRILDSAGDQPTYRLQRIVDGDYDAYLTQWAREIKTMGGPVALRPMHEMNGNWYPWSGTVNGNSPELFKQAWQRMHGIFTKEGASNVTWVWSVNNVSVPGTPENSWGAYYPGDEYVDWVGISGYNWGTSAEGQRWLSFDGVYREPLQYLETLGKPIMLTEIASVPDGGDKAVWIANAYALIRDEHPEIQAVIYYDALEKRRSDAQDWRIDRPQEAASAFQAAVGDSHFLPGPVPELEAWLNELSAAQKQFLRGIDSIGR